MMKVHIHKSKVKYINLFTSLSKKTSWESKSSLPLHACVCVCLKQVKPRWMYSTNICIDINNESLNIFYPHTHTLKKRDESPSRSFLFRFFTVCTLGKNYMYLAKKTANNFAHFEKKTGLKIKSWMHWRRARVRARVRESGGESERNEWDELELIHKRIAFLQHALMREKETKN